MSESYFYCVTLCKAHPTETWNPEPTNEEDMPPPINRLSIKQAVLGASAKSGEFNVVEVETVSLNSEVKIPIVVLKTGETRQCLLDLEFSNAPVTFTLIEGAGPVHLQGQHEVEPVEVCMNPIDEQPSFIQNDNQQTY